MAGWSKFKSFRETNSRVDLSFANGVGGAEIRAEPVENTTEGRNANANLTVLFVTASRIPKLSKLAKIFWQRFVVPTPFQKS